MNDDVKTLTAYPDCDCWEIKRRNCPTRIPKLEEALLTAKRVMIANGTDKVLMAKYAIAKIDEALKY